VVRSYPFAAAAAIAQLAHTALRAPRRHAALTAAAAGAATLNGVWWALCVYYLVLLIAFLMRAARLNAELKKR
jgi:hypothetical protein